MVDRVRNILRRLADDAASFADGSRVGLGRAAPGAGVPGAGPPPADRRAAGATAPGRADGRIQVVVTETEAFIPVEFVYDLPTPTVDAGLCDNAERALADGRCDPANRWPDRSPAPSPWWSARWGSGPCGR